MQQVAYREQTGYPVQFSVDYPDRPLNRLSTAFRTILVIPIAILLSTLSGGVLFFAPLLMILFHRKYPRWWFDWNLELQRFTNRVDALIELCAENHVAFVPFFAIGPECPALRPSARPTKPARTSSPKSPASTEPPRRKYGSPGPSTRDRTSSPSPTLSIRRICEKTWRRPGCT